MRRRRRPARGRPRAPRAAGPCSRAKSSRASPGAGAGPRPAWRGPRPPRRAGARSPARRRCPSPPRDQLASAVPGAGRQAGRPRRDPRGPSVQLLQGPSAGHDQVVAHPPVRRSPGSRRRAPPAAPETAALAGVGPVTSQAREASASKNGIEGHDVPGVGRANEVVAELAAQPRHDRVHGGGRERGGGVVPHQVEEDLGGDRPAAPGDEHREDVARDGRRGGRWPSRSGPPPGPGRGRAPARRSCNHSQV